VFSGMQHLMMAHRQISSPIHQKLFSTIPLFKMEHLKLTPKPISLKMSQQISIFSCLQAPRYTPSHFAITKLQTLYLQSPKHIKAPKDSESA